LPAPIPPPRPRRWWLWGVAAVVLASLIGGGYFVYQDVAAKEKKKEAGQHFSTGQMLLGINSPDRAIAEFRTSLGLNPDDDDVHFALARALENKGALSEAIDEYRAALTLQPRNALWHAALAAALEARACAAPDPRADLLAALAHYRTAALRAPSCARYRDACQRLVEVFYQRMS